MNILVVDDEPLARARLRRLIEAIPGRVCVGEAADGMQALAACERLRPDVVLLDIRMPGPDGLAVAQTLAVLPVSPVVIFTTAYADFAVDAFDAGAVHYLLKPVSAERLAQALARVTLKAQPGLLLERGGDSQRVPLTDVLYLQADSKYLTVYTHHGEWLLEGSLAVLQVRYASQLLRIHRAVLVNPEHLKALTRDADGRVWARLQGVAALLPVSRRLAGNVQRVFERG